MMERRAEETTVQFASVLLFDVILSNYKVLQHSWVNEVALGYFDFSMKFWKSIIFLMKV